MHEVRVRAFVSGRVQGVAFRWSTVAETERLALSGWVRNLDDGRVEFEAEGPEGAVDALLAWAHAGPPAARVASVESSRIALEGDDGFRVRH